MGFRNLRSYLELLEKNNTLLHVDRPISTVLEMTEIHTRLLSEKGPAVIFDNPVGPNGMSYEIPVLINLFGTVERIAQGLERKPDELRELGKTLAFLRQPAPPGGWKEAAGMLPIVKTVLAMKPKFTNSAPCQEVVLKDSDIDLGKLPIQTCWPGEPAPLITWPIVVTQDPQDTNNNFNLGVYRMQVLGPDRTLMRWLKHRGGAQHHSLQKQLVSKDLPAAVVIGIDPGTMLSAVSPVPENISEYQFAGILRNQKLTLCDCKTIPIKVPAESEIVLEGHVSLTEYEDEGPYGDHTGYYNSIEKFPIFKISAITMRHNPIYVSTFTGRPPDEPSVLGEALNELFIPLLTQQFPEISDFWLPPEGCSYRLAVVSIKKSYPGHAKRIMMAIWSYLRQFLYTKIIVVVDEDINVRDWADVIWALSTRMDPSRDVTILDSTPIDYLDFASPVSGLGGKIGFDATNKIPPETSREWGQKLLMSDEIIKKVNIMWDDLGLPGVGTSIWE
ncbi:MAG: UbiD family decarboxylase [Pseudomonadota bacterium]|nr:UbiD family decarboxylase [Pseudomonadota bacterium]